MISGPFDKGRGVIPGFSFSRPGSAIKGLVTDVLSFSGRRGGLWRIERPGPHAAQSGITRRQASFLRSNSSMAAIQWPSAVLEPPCTGTASAAGELEP